MKNNNCGYYYFGIGLGNAIIRQNNHRFSLSFYLYRRTIYKFESVNIIWLLKIDKLIFFRKKYDLIHLSDQDARLKVIKGKSKIIVTIHDMNKMHLNNIPAKKIQSYLRRIQNLIAKADKVVAISQFVAGDIVKYFPEAKQKLSIIYNGADRLAVKKGHSPVYRPGGEFLFTIVFYLFRKGFTIYRPF